MSQTLFYCQSCNAMVAADGKGELHACTCGSHYFRDIDQFVWKLTRRDRRFLQSLGIDREDTALHRPTT